MKKLTFLCLIIVLAACLIFPSCSKEATTTTSPVTSTSTSSTSTTATTASSSTAVTPQYGGVLRIISQRLPVSAFGLPAKLQTTDTEFSYPAIETLLRIDTENHYTPWLATDFKVSDDKSSVTFNLRNNVKFHDGSVLNAEVVKWNLDQQIAAKKTVASNWSSIDVIDDDTIRVNLKYWENLTISNITQVGIISKVAYDTLGEEALSNHPVGTGPFIFKSFNKDVSLEYEKFPDYWIAGKPYLDGIKYICISDIVTSVSAFTVGDADLTEASEAKVMYDLSQVPGVSFVYADTGTMVLKPDAANADSPWSNKLVRQAVEYAINKELLVKATGYGIFTKADQCALPGTIGYIPNLTPRNYDLAKAKQLMIDAGYPEGFETTLCYTQNGYKDGAVAIQAALQEININATLEYADSAKYGQYLSNGWHNTAIYTPAGGGSNFITGIRNLFMTPGFNASLKGPDELEGLYNAALQTVDVEPALVEKASQAIFDDDSLIPISYMGLGVIYYNNVHDTNHLNYFSFTMWAVESAWISQ